MGLLFNASAIFIGYKRGVEKFMKSQYTISLAAYELGNTVRKECFVYRTMTPKQARDIIDALSESQSQGRKTSFVSNFWWLLTCGDQH